MYWVRIFQSTKSIEQNKGNKYIVFHVLLQSTYVSKIAEEMKPFYPGYPAMAKYLNQTGRHIMYSCEWAIYDRAKGVDVSNIVP